MKQYTLDDIRAAADKKYGSLEIPLEDGTVVELVNALRLPKEKRRKLTKLQDQLDADGADVDAQEDILLELLRAVCRSNTQADKLIESFDGDLAQVVATFELYSSETQTGEASGSQS